MRAWQLTQFGIDGLSLIDAPEPTLADGQVLVRVRAMSLNYRDLLVVRGQYNPNFRLPAIPISDAAGVIERVGAGVTPWRPGDRVLGNFVAGWIDGPFQAAHVGTTLGLPGPGMAAERVVLPADCLVAVPAGFDDAQAATLPIAALTAWSALVTEGGLSPERPQQAGWVLTLGTGGVSIFALQLARAMGQRVILTSSNDEKLQRARALGADGLVNYRRNPDWERAVVEITGGVGADITVETSGAGTLDRSLKATRPGGRIGLLGALTGLRAEVTVGLILMKRLRICGIMVDSRRSFEAMNRFLERSAIRPVVDRTFAFDELPAALRYLESGSHFGKVVVTGAA